MSNATFSIKDVSPLSLVNFQEPTFWYCVAWIIANPLLWNLVARNEYRNKSITKIFGNKYYVRVFPLLISLFLTSFSFVSGLLFPCRLHFLCWSWTRLGVCLSLCRACLVANIELIMQLCARSAQPAQDCGA